MGTLGSAGPVGRKRWQMFAGIAAISLTLGMASCGGGDDDGDNCSDTVEASTAAICANIAAGLACGDSSLSGTTCSLSNCVCDQCAGWEDGVETQAECAAIAAGEGCDEYIFDDGINACTYFACDCTIIDDDDDVIDDVFDDDDF